jgi:hypothetical protein
VTLVDCDNEDTNNNGGADAASTTTSSGGSGNAVVSSSVGNASVNATVQQSVPDTNDYGPEDFNDVE